MGKQISLEEKLVSIGDNAEETCLLGNDCVKCGLTFFPQRKYCSKCCIKLEGERKLSKKGKIVAFSVVYRKPKFSVIGEPYALGEVELFNDGVHVFGILDISQDDLAVGLEVELDLEKLRDTEDGDSVMGYKFRQVS